MPSGEKTAKLHIRATVLGAAVAISGPAYFGTLFSNIAVSVYLRQGRTMQEAYALLNRFDLSLLMVVGLLTNAALAITCGWVAAAYGRGRPLLHGLVAGALAASFPAIMLFGPMGGGIPLGYALFSLALPLLGSVVGAYAYARLA